MIVFKKIRWKNLLSTGNQFIEVNLNEHKSVIMVGLNGAGKSTILDALCFVLFGKAFREINKPTLVNSTNKKDLVVELEFSVAGKEFKIIRGIKPNIFEVYCNATLIDQNSKADYQDYLEKYILKMNFRSFTQIVILGSASFKPFMQLTAAERRTIIEDLLDIQIFSMMNVVAKQKAQATKDELADYKKRLEFLDEKQAIVERTLEKLQELSESKVDKLKADLDKLTGEYNSIKQSITNATREYNKQVAQVGDDTKLRAKHQKLIALASKIETNLARHKEHVKFYNEHDDCPVCKQAIQKEFKAEIVDKTGAQVTELTEGMEKINKEITQIIAEINEVVDRKNTTNELRHRIRLEQGSADNLYARIGNIQAEINQPREDSLAVESKAELKAIEIERTQLIGLINEKSEDKDYLDTAILLLKDGGIKTKIIKQYLPIINKQINNYLAAMEFAVNFEIDEGFKETIKSQYRNEFSYNNFSEGEKMRIDLALLFTWRTVAKLKNSVNTNLLILDEVFDSSLDGNGTDDFMKIIGAISDSTNVIVISHKGDQLQDKFDKLIKFEKVKGYATIID